MTLASSHQSILVEDLPMAQHLMRLLLDFLQVPLHHWHIIRLLLVDRLGLDFLGGPLVAEVEVGAEVVGDQYQ